MIDVKPLEKVKPGLAFTDLRWAGVYADDFLQGLMVMGIIILLIGLVVAIGSAIGAGLMTMGVGLVISGIGGTIYFKTPSILIGGSSGVVLILVGAFFDHFTSSTGV